MQRNLQLQCRRQELLKLTAVVDFLGRESLPSAVGDSLDDANKDEQELGLSMKAERFHSIAQQRGGEAKPRVAEGATKEYVVSCQLFFSVLLIAQPRCLCESSALERLKVSHRDQGHRR